ncbi:tubulin polyglutamylase TTLL4 isoform X2 [Cryptotermes secundus]|uniref:tubulin polyglutamylase TTLL4 isoform X2 n=1 Tax=Cryptotermes secundus TaxID=105785 RepID=UPI000CD7DC81|nr:tubulin polyglutamylase TTLL4 isoform X2 [Cryptotermes secundus]
MNMELNIAGGEKHKRLAINGNILSLNNLKSMATPYVVQKVTLNHSNSGYHHPESQGEFSCGETTHRNPNYYQCHFAHASWCHVCEVRRSLQCGRRRSKSEGLEADPLRECNRLHDSRYDNEHWRKKVVTEYDLCSYQPNSHEFVRQADSRQSHSPREILYQTLPQPMDVDGTAEQHRTIVPLKKYKDCFLKGHPHYQHKNTDNSFPVTQSMLLPEANENPKHFINSYDACSDVCPDRGHSLSDSFPRKLTKKSCDTVKRNGALCNQTWTEGGECGKWHFSQKPKANNVGNHFRSLYGFTIRQDAHFCGTSGENNHCCHSHRLNEEGGAAPSRHPFVVDTASMQDRYLHEVEVLRSKLRELRGGVDGKRLRQRSESEPGAGFGGSCQDSSWEPKRARDGSPGLTENLNCCYIEDTKCSSYAQHQSEPSVSHSSRLEVMHVHKPSVHRGHNTKILHFPVSSKTVIGKHSSDLHDDDDASLSSDSDFADSERTCGSGEDGDSKGEPGEDSEEADDQSVLSSLTTISNDSNTPSVVGETLGSISLSDHAHRKVIPVTSMIETKGLPGCLRMSLFSYVPPYIHFTMHDVKGEGLPAEIQRHMKWKLSTITPLVIRRTLVNSGFRLVRKSNDWCGTWGKHMKSLCFKTLKEFQKINHFPGTFQIGRKDRLWKNLYRLMTKFGKKEFGFIPRTYVLPQDSKLLRQAWEKSCGKEKWIIKPPASARGTGIKVVHRWAQIPKKRPLVVQKYISQPYLINGSKFDLRLYVLVTNINPLRIYIYDDGLVRFASVKYSSDMASLGDRYMHLTNYSINKMSSQYTQNEDATACQGHKWTVKTLWTYLEKEGVDVTALWNSLVDLVIKTIISGESSINQLTRANLVSRYCSYELFGIDVLLDETLKPWLLEVNISPSLHSSSPLDLAVKGPMVRDLLNMAGYQVPNKLLIAQQEEILSSFGVKDKTIPLCFDKRLYITALSKEERNKHSFYQQNCSREEYLEDILKHLTPDDVRHLIQSEDELTQAGRFLKIFPTTATHMYHEFFEAPRYYNMMFDAWENKYSGNRQEGIELLESLCLQKAHLVIPVPGGLTKSSASQSKTFPTSPSPPPAHEEKYETQPVVERKVQCLSSVALYRAARPRSGKFSVVLKPYPRSAYLTRKAKPSITPAKTSSSAPTNSVIEVQSSSHPTLDDHPVKEVASY